MIRINMILKVFSTLKPACELLMHRRATDNYIESTDILCRDYMLNPRE